MITGIKPSSFRLPDETSVGRVALQVRDLDQSVEFYSKLLGFDVLQSSPDAVRLGTGNQELLELHGGATSSQRERRLGLYHFAILLPDRPALGAFLRNILEAGIQPGASDHLVSEALYIKDPDNLGIEIYRDRPREEWRLQGKEVAMATDPLDFNSVLAAGDSHRWAGIPAGTRIGHVHLHVGELAKARDFYHEALGLDIMVQSYPGALFLAAGGYHHHLGVNTWAGPKAQASPEDEARLLVWELVVPAEAKTRVAGSLAERGYAITAEGVDDFMVPDPWGTVVRIKGSN